MFHSTPILHKELQLQPGFSERSALRQQVGHGDLPVELLQLQLNAARKYLLEELRSVHLNTQDTRPLFSCPMSATALHCLLHLTAPTVYAESDIDPVGEMLDQSMEHSVSEGASLHLIDDLVQDAHYRKQQVFFEVVSAQPSRAVKAAPAQLTADDIGIMPLKCLGPGPGVRDAQNPNHRLESLFSQPKCA